METYLQEQIGFCIGKINEYANTVVGEPTSMGYLERTVGSLEYHVAIAEKRIQGKARSLRLKNRHPRETRPLRSFPCGVRKQAGRPIKGQPPT